MFFCRFGISRLSGIEHVCMIYMLNVDELPPVDLKSSIIVRKKNRCKYNNFINKIESKDVSMHLNNLIVIYLPKQNKKKKTLSRLSLTCQVFAAKSILVESALKCLSCIYIIYIYKRMGLHANTLTDKPIVYSNKCNHHTKVLTQHMYIYRATEKKYNKTKYHHLFASLFVCTNIHQFSRSFLLYFNFWLNCVFNRFFTEHDFLIAQSVHCIHSVFLITLRESDKQRDRGRWRDRLKMNE